MAVHVSLITVNYGSADRIAELSASLKKFAPEVEYEWIVVDNFTSKEHQAHLAKIIDNHPGGHLIPLSQNVGFGAANNVGARFATGKYLCFVNPDICIKDGSITPLLDHLKRHPKDLVAPKIVDHTGKRMENARNFPTMWHLFVRRAFHKTDCITPEKTQSVPWVQGSFMVLEKALFETLGGFDERFFLFLEDTDLCRRVSEHGGQVVIVPSACVEHGTERLSGNSFWPGMFKSTFWIHLKSAVRYFRKWRKKKSHS